MSVTVIRSNELQLRDRGGPPGIARVGRAISSDLSPSMGAGIAQFDKCSSSWRVLYDEIIYVIEGTFTLTSGGQVHQAKAGDIMWIPKGTSLKYGGEGAKLFYTVYPGNWKELMQAANSADALETEPSN